MSLTESTRLQPRFKPQATPKFSLLLYIHFLQYKKGRLRLNIKTKIDHLHGDQFLNFRDLFF